jgi:hypothetical protein
MVDRFYGYSRFLSAAIGLVVSLSALMGCDEKDIPVLSDKDEIERYLTDTQEGRELFRTDGLINSDTFTIPNDSAVYVDVVESVSRTIFYMVAPTDELKRFKEPNLSLVDAEIEVTDRFSVQRFRIVGSDTTSTFDTREFIRYGLFLKLGDDFKPFAGWKLFGFNGRGPAFPGFVTVDGPNNQSISVYGPLYKQLDYARIDPITGEFGSYVFRTIQSYVRVDQIPNFDGGGDIDVSLTSVQSDSEYLLVGGQARTGAVTEPATRVSADAYSYTLTSQFSPPYLWNLLVFQESHSGGQNFSTWCVPYRVP